MKKVSSAKSFGGLQLRYSHLSVVLDCEMHFSIYLPPLASEKTPVPVIYWLSGLTCTDENFVQKAGAQAFAAKYNVAVVAPDTSPRGEGVPDDPDGSWDFGLGAGFYVDAQQMPWKNHYQMYSYVVDELPRIIESGFPVNGQKSLMGHSMGGHGALTIALKNPTEYQCVSAFSPICAPMHCAWGQKALSHYIGDDKSLWMDYDTCELIKREAGRLKEERALPIWIEQGTSDDFLETQLLLNLLQAQSEQSCYPMSIQYREGYDHSYFFIASFIEEHIQNHARALRPL